MLVALFSHLLVACLRISFVETCSTTPWPIEASKASIEPALGVYQSCYRVLAEHVMVCGCAKVRRCENRLLAKQVDSACFWRCLRRAGSWASSLIAMRSAGGGRPLSTGGITTFLSPASSSSHILSIILLCICSLAKQVGATFRLEACGWFYAAAGRWAANPRLSELYGGEMVLNNCIWCHTSPRSPVEVAAKLRSWIYSPLA